MLLILSILLGQIIAKPCPKIEESDLLEIFTEYEPLKRDHPHHLTDSNEIYQFVVFYHAQDKEYHRINIRYKDTDYGEDLIDVDAINKFKDLKYAAKLVRIFEAQDYVFVIIKEPEFYSLHDFILFRDKFKDQKEALVFVSKVMDFLEEVDSLGYVFGAARPLQIGVTKELQPVMMYFHKVRPIGSKEKNSPSKIFFDPYNHHVPYGSDIEYSPQTNTWNIGELLLFILAYMYSDKYLEEVIRYFNFDPDSKINFKVKLPKNVSLEVAQILDQSIKYWPHDRAQFKNLRHLVDKAISQKSLTFDDKEFSIDLFHFSSVFTRKFGFTEILVMMLGIMAIVVIISGLYYINNYSTDNEEKNDLTVDDTFA